MSLPVEYRLDQDRVVRPKRYSTGQRALSLEKQENISLCGLSGLGAMRGRSDKLGSLAKYAKGAKEEDQETFLGGLGAKIFLEVVLLNIVSVKTYAKIEGCANSFCLSGNAPLRPAGLPGEDRDLSGANVMACSSVSQRVLVAL